MWLSLAGLLLEQETLREPLDSVRRRINSERSISRTSSFLKRSPKKLFIESTMCLGSHVGRVQAVTVL